MLVVLLMGGMFTLCSAQKNFTVWYGANYTKVFTKGDSPGYEVKFLNLGVDYTSRISEKIDWTVGAGYVTKGCKDWDPGYVQIEANLDFIERIDENKKVGFFVGPFADVLVNKDDAEGAKSSAFGLQAGGLFSINKVYVRYGFEYGFTDLIKEVKSKPFGLAVRVGYNF